MSTSERSGIATEYAGTTFRSRLEARWARFFDLIGWQWEYEPFDADGYVPDFAIIGRSSLLIEVKPYADVATLAAEAERIKPRVGLGWPGGHVAVFGMNPLLPLTEFWDQYSPGVYAAGGSDWGTPPARSPLGWAFCSYKTAYGASGHRECGAISVFHSQDSYQTIPCGHGDGDHHLHGGDPSAYLKAAWTSVRDKTQWGSGR